ncbi:putative E3 ubiquitin-protein ligase RING1b [Vigna angularis]|uniref:putative E3 ubiquitin-protein ligase RING1b n=1 Tax=Phaseolus angularis TaxID=3914 RepID=UPI00080A4A7C|nr:putative E3 ubiquitin-protein ligase RING1b [Vigna angularis]
MSAQKRPHEQPQDEAESEQNGSLSNLDKDKEYVVMDLSILKCGICRGFIQNTMTLMECFHKFCKECIEKSMRLGVNKCPVCDVHVDSQLSLKEDSQYDALVTAIVPHVVKYKKKGEVALRVPRRTNDQEASFQQSYASVSGEKARSNRLAKLVDHLRKSDENVDEMEIHLVLISLDEQRIPSLQEPYLLCRPTCSVKTLCKYVEIKAELQADQVELFLIEESEANVVTGNITIDPDKDKLRVLQDEETLAQLYTPNVTNCGHLLLAYKMK